MNNQPPINAQVQPLAGRQLPRGWMEQSANAARGAWDQRDLENLWKSAGNKQQSVDSPIKNARLKPLSWSEIYGEK